MQEVFGQLMGDTARLWRIHLNEKLKPMGLSYAKYSTLLMLDRYSGELVQNKLANLLSIEHPTLARVLNDLQKNDWIEKKQHSKDKRVKIIFFTKNGKNRFEKCKQIVNNFRKEILFDIDEKRLKQNIEVLEQIFNNLFNLQEIKCSKK
jgi:MarR family transcriptional regulator for hemolysin